MLVLVFRAYRMVYVSLTSLNVGVDLNERECVRSEVELVYSRSMDSREQRRSNNNRVTV